MQTLRISISIPFKHTSSTKVVCAQIKLFNTLQQQINALLAQQQFANTVSNDGVSAYIVDGDNNAVY